MPVIKPLLLPLVAALGMHSVAIAQEALPPGEIRANGDIAFDEELKLGKRESNKIAIISDALQIFGSGSTGDIRGKSKPGATGTSRRLQGRFAERPSVIDYGADPTGATDSTAAFTAALASESPVSAPCGTFRIDSTVEVTKRADFRGAGTCTLLRFDLPTGLPVLPAIDIKSTAAGSSLQSFRVDHQAHVRLYKPNTIYGGNTIASSAILVQADDTSLSQVTVDNAYDNGIAVVQFAGKGFEFTPGSPKRYSLKTIRTSYCGVGSMPKAGAGIDVGTGSYGTVDDLVDIGSYGAFILDVGGGGQGAFSNMTGISTKADPNYHSYTFYVGSGNSTFTNLYSQEAEHSALWLDGFAGRTTMSNIVIKAPKSIGVQIKAGDTIISNLIVNSAGYTKPPGSIDAVQLDSTANTLSNVLINGLSVQNEFSTARYGINRLGSGPLTGAVVNANLSGAASATNNLPDTFGVVDGAVLSNVLTGAWTSYTPTVACATRGQFLAKVATAAQFRRVGKTVSVNLSAISIMDRGTCTGAINVSLPSKAATRTTFSGQETSVSGVALVGVIFEETSNLQIKHTDGTTPAVDGYVLTGRTEYQAQ